MTVLEGSFVDGLRPTHFDWKNVTVWYGRTRAAANPWIEEALHAAVAGKELRSDLIAPAPPPKVIVQQGSSGLSGGAVAAIVAGSAGADTASIAELSHACAKLCCRSVPLPRQWGSACACKAPFAYTTPLHATRLLHGVAKQNGRYNIVRKVTHEYRPVLVASACQVCRVTYICMQCLWRSWPPSRSSASCGSGAATSVTATSRARAQCLPPRQRRCRCLSPTARASAVPCLVGACAPRHQRRPLLPTSQPLHRPAAAAHGSRRLRLRMHRTAAARAAATHTTVARQHPLEWRCARCHSM